MCKYNSSDHIHGVVRSEGDQLENLTEEGEYCKVTPVNIPYGIKFQGLNYAGTDVSRVKEICSFTIRHENTEHSWISPVVTLRDLQKLESLHVGSKDVEDHHG